MSAQQTRARLEELRAVGDRLMLGDPDARKVRGLVCDVLDALLGRVPNHDDVNISGARAAPLEPARLGVVVPGMHGGPPLSRPQALAALGAPDDAETIAEIERMAAAAGAAPAAVPGAEPAPPLSLAEALERAAVLKAEKERQANQGSKAPTPNGGQ